MVPNNADNTKRQNTIALLLHPFVDLEFRFLDFRLLELDFDGVFFLLDVFFLRFLGEALELTESGCTDEESLPDLDLRRFFGEAPWTTAKASSSRETDSLEDFLDLDVRFFEDLDFFLSEGIREMVYQGEGHTPVSVT